MNKRQGVFVLILLISLLLIINYEFMDTRLEGFLAYEGTEYANVTRIIDGDTIEIGGNESVRLLGINTPERGEKYYQEAKAFLSDLVLNETIKLEKVGSNKDKYYRLLRYVFLSNKNVNVELVKAGFANYYFYSGKDKYTDELEKAWNTCIHNRKNLCEPSVNTCALCMKINADYITNTCDFSCDISGWIIKGEGREKFIFNKALSFNGIAKFELDLTSSSGSLFLRDENGKLVLWQK